MEIRTTMSTKMPAYTQQWYTSHYQIWKIRESHF